MTEDLTNPASAAAKVLAEAAGTDQWKPVLRTVRRLGNTQSGYDLAHLESEIERMQHLLGGRALDLDHSHRDQLIERFRQRVEQLLSQVMELDELRGCAQLLEQTIQSGQGGIQDFTVVPLRDPGKVLQVDVRYPPFYADGSSSRGHKPGSGMEPVLPAACSYSLIIESAVGRKWPILTDSSSRLTGYHLRRSPILERMVQPPSYLSQQEVYGREDTLKQLKRLASEPDGRVHVISGPTGTGKTATALALATYARDQDIPVWWIRCHPGYTHATMAALAFLLGANTRDLAEARAGRRSLQDLVWGLLKKAETPWLMIMDDCGHGDPSASSSPLTWARPSRHGLVVVTTRAVQSPKRESRTQRYFFGGLPRNSQAELLAAHAPHNGAGEELQRLADYFGELPLTLSLWSTYLNLAGTSAQSIVEYNGELSDTNIEHADDGLPVLRPGFLIDILLQVLEGQGIPQARPLFGILVHFAAEIALPEVVLSSINPGESELFLSIKDSQLQADIERGLDALLRAGLFEGQSCLKSGGEPPRSAVQLNSSINHAYREQLARTPSKLRAVRAAAAATLHAAVRKYLSADERDWAGCTLIIPHVYSLLETLQHGAPETAFDDATAAACAMADFLLSTGAYQDAEHLARRAHEVARQLENDHPASLETRLCLASTLMARGRLGEAQEMIHHVHSVREQVLGPGHPETLRVLEKLALCLRDQGRLREAGLALRQVVSGRQRLLGEDHAETLRALSSLSAILWAQGKIGEAERSLRRVVEGRQRILKPDHPEVSAALAMLATILRDRGRLREAERALRKVLQVSEQAFGKDDPGTLEVLAELAETLRGQGRLKEAESGLRRVLAAREWALGKDDPDTLDVQVALAETLREQGKLKHAKAMLLHALHGQAVRLSAHHPDMLNTRVCLAAASRDLGDFADAEEILRSAACAYEQTVEPDHPIILCVRHDLAAVLQDMGRFDEAEEICKEVLDLREWTLGPNHPETLDTLANIGCLLRSRGALREAQDAIRHALTGYQDLLGADHPISLTIMSNLAGVLCEQGRFADALEMYKTVLTGREQTLGKKHPDTFLARANLAAALLCNEKLRSAEKLLKYVLNASDTQAGSARQARVAALYNLAVIYHRKRRYEAAEASFREVVRIRAADLGADHPDTLAARNELARVLTAMGRRGEATREYESLLQGAERFVAAAGA
jgi:tetratricopeptide (TPR) repeat protein